MPTKVEGLERLKARFAKIPVEMRAQVKVAIEQGADELVAMQKRLVPVGGGDDPHTGKLKESIHKEPGRHDLSVVVKAGGPTTTVTGTYPYDYALAVEFGTKKMTAEPFFWPSYRALRRRIRSRISRAMRKAVGKR